MSSGFTRPSDTNDAGNLLIDAARDLVMRIVQDDNALEAAGAYTAANQARVQYRRLAKDSRAFVELKRLVDVVQIASPELRYKVATDMVLAAENLVIVATGDIGLYAAAKAHFESTRDVSVSQIMSGTTYANTITPLFSALSRAADNFATEKLPVDQRWEKAAHQLIRAAKDIVAHVITSDRLLDTEGVYQAASKAEVKFRRFATQSQAFGRLQTLVAAEPMSTPETRAEIVAKMATEAEGITAVFHDPRSSVYNAAVEYSQRALGKTYPNPLSDSLPVLSSALETYQRAKTAKEREQATAQTPNFSAFSAGNAPQFRFQ